MRYIIKSFYAEDDLNYDQRMSLVPDLCVSDHESIPTGILTADGDMIYRAPREIGFGRDID